MALSIADRGYVIQTGQVVLADTAQSLLTNPQMREAYLGSSRCSCSTATSSGARFPMRAAIDALEAGFRAQDPSAQPLRSHLDDAGRRRCC